MLLHTYMHVPILFNGDLVIFLKRTFITFCLVELILSIYPKRLLYKIYTVHLLLCGSQAHIHSYMQVFGLVLILYINN